MDASQQAEWMVGRGTGAMVGTCFGAGWLGMSIGVARAFSPLVIVIFDACLLACAPGGLGALDSQGTQIARASWRNVGGALGRIPQAIHGSNSCGNSHDPRGLLGLLGCESGPVDSGGNCGNRGTAFFRPGQNLCRRDLLRDRNRNTRLLHRRGNFLSRPIHRMDIAAGIGTGLVLWLSAAYGLLHARRFARAAFTSTSAPSTN
jgi:hypothetical protein